MPEIKAIKEEALRFYIESLKMTPEEKEQAFMDINEDNQHPVEFD